MFIIFCRRVKMWLLFDAGISVWRRRSAGYLGLEPSGIR